ncbi:probable protein phosphatase 2C 73 [Asparagus officinalis]|uniref:probable protein phosphatase 2C 73 n=1 Tax=Asparagus officinalis TaxID=4686 RepID=UPI00098E6059|nr:probable protein phosphatase 2C 73 [Asparagus officinalis]
MGSCCSKGRKKGRHGGENDQEFEVFRFQDCADQDAEDGARVGEGGARVRLRGSSSCSSMFSQQGWKGVNQDAMTIWEDFGGASDTTFCGVFDGHGPYGHRVACYIRDNLPSKLSSRLNSLQTILDDDNHVEPNDDNADTSEFSSWKSTFTKAFEELDKELSNHATIDCICSGTTAVSIVKQREHLMIANLGDSRAILCTRDNTNQLVPVQLTVDLKPNLPSEEERITSCRGRVFALDEEPDVHRIWLPDEDCPGLAMARAFGDFCLKDFGLISTPQVSYRKISEKDEFLVLATDGVWDVLSNEDVIRIISSATKRSDAAKQVVQQAVKSWRSKHPTSKVDDCAVICLFLKSPLLSAKSSFTTRFLSSQTSELSFTESFKTAKSEDLCDETEDIKQETKELWTALEGVSRANSLMKIPRFASLPSVLSWRKKSVKVLEEIE